MKAAQINKYGSSAVVEINTSANKPFVTEGKVVVEVHAAGVNPVDWIIRMGYLQQIVPLSFPAILEGDFSGVVTEAGNGVSEFKICEKYRSS